MTKFYLKVKVWFNYLLDRVIDAADLILMDVYRLPWPITRQRAHQLARYIGNSSWFLRDFPRLSAYKLAGQNGTIIFVGRAEGVWELRHLFFGEEDVVFQEIGRVALWQLQGQVRQWLAHEADLVICELSKLYPWKLEAPITFRVPTWIHQSLDLPEPLEDLLSGRHVKSVRHNLNRASKAGFSWYFSRSKEDFDNFYYNMYLPHIKNRHEERALLASYEDQWQRWFTKGGLVVVTQNEKPVGGVICYVKNRVCFAIEMGVLNGDPELIQQGIKISSDWFAINWGYEQGARTYSMGGTRPYRSDGIFVTKSRWRAQVMERKKIYGTWTFLGEDLPSALKKQINELGFISQIDKKFYGISVIDDSQCLGSNGFEQEVATAQKQGLAGIAAISSEAPPKLYEQSAIVE